MPLDLELNEEQKLLQKGAREFAQEEFTPERAAEFERKKEFPWDLWKECGKQGYIGLTWPEEYGGQGLDQISFYTTGYELVRAEPYLASTVFAGMYGADLIADHGTEEQKAKWLPKIARGEITSAGCFTEPEGGSDITRVLDTRAERDEQGDWVINGTKTLITNGTTASVFLVLAQTDPEAEKPHRGMTEFVIERSEGIEASKFENKMGWHASPTCEVFFNDVHATDEDILGGPDNLNKGFYLGMSLIDWGRLGIGLQALGIAENAFEAAVSYSKERKAFGKKIAGFQGLAFQLVDIETRIELLKSLVSRAIRFAIKAREDPTLMEESIKLSSMVKWYGARTAKDACDVALDVLGGTGYVGSHVERWYRFAKGIELYEGTKEVQKSTIARISLGKEFVREF